MILCSLWTENLVKIPSVFSIFELFVLTSLMFTGVVLTFSSLLASSARTKLLVLVFNQSGGILTNWRRLPLARAGPECIHLTLL